MPGKWSPPLNTFLYIYLTNQWASLIVYTIFFWKSKIWFIRPLLINVIPWLNSSSSFKFRSKTFLLHETYLHHIFWSLYTYILIPFYLKVFKHILMLLFLLKWKLFRSIYPLSISVWIIIVNTNRLDKFRV